MTEQRIAEIKAEFEKIQGVTVKDADSTLKRVRKHLMNPERKRLKEIETEIVTQNIDLGLQYGKSESVTRPPQKCKMCGRVVTSKNAIAGMGPTGATSHLR